MNRHWKNNWPFYAVMIPIVVLLIGLLVWHEERVDDVRARCDRIGAVAVEKYNGGGFVCVEVVTP